MSAIDHAFLESEQHTRETLTHLLDTSRRLSRGDLIERLDDLVFISDAHKRLTAIEFIQHRIREASNEVAS